MLGDVRFTSDCFQFRNDAKGQQPTSAIFSEVGIVFRSLRH